MAAGQRSAGILAVRGQGAELEFFLVHPGGPFFAKKDEGAWSIPKGLIDPEEDPLRAAQRELHEETGFPIPEGPYYALGTIKQRGGKIVEAWAVRADFDPANMVSNTFELEWPRGSGRVQTCPECDRGEWFDRATADRKINPAQIALLERAAKVFG